MFHALSGTQAFNYTWWKSAAHVLEFLPGLIHP